MGDSCIRRNDRLMANKVGELVRDIGYRIGDPKLDDFPPAVVLRAMRRVYGQLNEDLKVVERELSVDFSSPGADDSVDDGYWGLPADWIRPFKMSVDYRYVPSKVFKNTEYRTFTIYNNRIYFASVSADTTLTVCYYSAGYTLVDADDGDVGTGEVNEPEYPDHLQDVLMYGTCIELTSKYDKFEVDVRRFLERKSALGRLSTYKQDVSPEKTGPLKYQTLVDTEDYDEYGVL